MGYDKLERSIDEVEGRLTSAALPVLMRKVYMWMTMALVISGLTAYEVATSETMLNLLFGSPFSFWGIIIATFALVWAINGAINRLSLITATLLFILFSALNGAMCATVFLSYTMSSIASTFFITAGTFGAMTLFGYVTRTDLTSIGRICFMGLIGLIIASIVNIFVGSSMLMLICSYVGVIIFVGLTAYDTQKIREALNSFQYADESAQKVALIGALSLYLDFLNLFLYLLRIFGDRK